ncbi:SCO family protein [Deminuibacter soli]|uniref:SCO family protein n=1 Tax=Deminuibacter soli TaxID=2291815 RepID=A0A3E1NR54_9BACT|nr:SCO family protein [Deminuibacter soli]RFM30380.1 SCO family protein [Deminuibacter soli]
MNKKALLALCIAIFIPLFSYLCVRYVSQDAVIIPRHYLLDTVVEKVKDGKLTTDSIWHTTQDIRLVNQLGDTVNLYDIKNKIIVADFFFTSCGSICPTLTKNMARLQQSFLKGGDTRQRIDSSIVQFISFSVDPERDSVPRLKAYADHFGVNHDSWWMLTGPKDSIYNFAFEQLKVDKFSEEPVSPDFVHTSRFVLIDRDYQIRGYYNGLDTVSLRQLARDIGILMLEKEHGAKAKLPFDPVLMGVIFLIAVILVVGILSIVKRKSAQTA